MGRATEIELRYLALRMPEQVARNPQGYYQHLILYRRALDFWIVTPGLFLTVAAVGLIVLPSLEAPCRLSQSTFRGRVIWNMKEKNARPLYVRVLSW